MNQISSMRAFAQTQIHLDLPVFATLHDLTWSCESNDVQSVGLAATAPVPGRCVSCQTLRQTDSNEEEGGEVVVVVVVGWVFCIAAGARPKLKVQFSDGFVSPLWYLRSD